MAEGDLRTPLIQIDEECSIFVENMETPDERIELQTPDERIELQTPEDLPRKGPVEKAPLIIGEIYYVKTAHGTKPWIGGKLVEILNVDCQKRVKTTYKVIEARHLEELILSGKEIAYMSPSNILLDVGTLVLAAFKEVSPDGMLKKSRCNYSGIVAEPPIAYNNYRYLIFFHNGYAQYVDFTAVYLILESESNAWEKVSPDLQVFIKKYLQGQEHALIEFAKDQTVCVKYADKWWLCTVINIDCSMVQVFFDIVNRIEWIFRGSDRLKPYVCEEQIAANRETEAILNDPGTYFTLEDECGVEYAYCPHNCSKYCKAHLTHYLGQLTGHNPLIKPLLCGWLRTIFRVNRNKQIMYTAPCGRSLRHMGEIHRYLTVTASDMTVDLFDFNPSNRCMVEFTVDCVPKIRDLAEGLEEVIIPVINEVNNDELKLNNYSKNRIPGKNTKLSLDSDFLCRCDCEDDCADKLRCECWRLTLEGVKYFENNLDPTSVGYVYRRLMDPVPTGIYECNCRCKCRQTCLNRVVQNSLSLKVQVYMTQDNLWGIRVLNDVPQGAFICGYAGTIRKQPIPNQDGDTYFLSMDYIESMEKKKEGYEASVQTEDTDSGSVNIDGSSRPPLKKTRSFFTSGQEIEVENTLLDSGYVTSKSTVSEPSDLEEPSYSGHSASDVTQLFIAGEEQNVVGVDKPVDSANTTSQNAHKLAVIEQHNRVESSGNGYSSLNKAESVIAGEQQKVAGEDKPVDNDNTASENTHMVAVTEQRNLVESSCSGYSSLDKAESSIASEQQVEAEDGPIYTGDTTSTEPNKPPCSSYFSSNKTGSFIAAEPPEFEDEDQPVYRGYASSEIGHMLTVTGTSRLEKPSCSGYSSIKNRHTPNPNGEVEYEPGRSGGSSAPKEPRTENVYSSISDDIFDLDVEVNIRRSVQRKTYSRNKDRVRRLQSFASWHQDRKRKCVTFSSNSDVANEKRKPISIRKTLGPSESPFVIDATHAANIGRFLSQPGTPNLFIQPVFVDTHDPRFPRYAFFTSQFLRAGTKLIWNQD